MLELRNISYYKDNKYILKDINLIINDNEFITITGKNGSGKSTLSKIIMGIIKPTSGSIIYNNIDITDMDINERSKFMSYSFQNPVKFKGISVYDLISISLNKKATKSEVCSILSNVGLCALEYIDREVNSTLSGGEIKRIEIASVLSRNSDIYIFDEPESGIDLWSFDKLTSIFSNLKNNNKTIIVVSHQEKIINLSDKVIVLSGGMIDNNALIDSKCCNKGVYNE